MDNTNLELPFFSNKNKFSNDYLFYFKGSDITSTSRLLVAIVKLCFQAKQWGLLN